MITQTKIKIPAVVGMVSLVGIHDEGYPISYGNYFSFAENYLKCVNMWAENLEEWVKRTHVDKIEVTAFKYSPEIKYHPDFCFVTDERVTKDWLIQNKICITGCGKITDLMHKTLLNFKNEP